MDAIRPDAVVIGVDTHKETHVAVALNGLGARLGQLAVTADGAGYHRLAEWARSMGEVCNHPAEATVALLDDAVASSA